MITRVMNLIAAVSVSTNAAAYGVILQDGYIVAARLTIATTLVANGNFFSGELSTTGSFLSSSNDSQGPFLFHTSGPCIVDTAVGYSWQAFTTSISGIAIPVKVNDRIYINTNQSAALATFDGQIYIANA